MQLYVKQLPNSRKVHLSTRGPGFEISDISKKQIQQAIADGKVVQVTNDGRFAVSKPKREPLCSSACAVKISLLRQKALDLAATTTGEVTVYLDYVSALDSIDPTKAFVWPVRPAGV